MKHLDPVPAVDLGWLAEPDAGLAFRAYRALPDVDRASVLAHAVATLTVPHLCGRPRRLRGARGGRARPRRGLPGRTRRDRRHAVRSRPRLEPHEQGADPRRRGRCARRRLGREAQRPEEDRPGDRGRRRVPPRSGAATPRPRPPRRAGCRRGSPRSPSRTPKRPRRPQAATSPSRPRPTRTTRSKPPTATRTPTATPRPPQPKTPHPTPTAPATARPSPRATTARSPRSSTPEAPPPAPGRRGTSRPGSHGRRAGPRFFASRRPLPPPRASRAAPGLDPRHRNRPAARRRKRRDPAPVPPSRKATRSGRAPRGLAVRRSRASPAAHRHRLLEGIPHDPVRDPFPVRPRRRRNRPDSAPVPDSRPDPGRAVAEAARALAPVLEAGRRLAAPVVLEAMRDAWRRVDPAGRSWNSKLCYDAAEAATVLFLRQWGRAMRGAADSPEAFLAMIERIAALEPTHSHRSEHQVAFDQFSTPLPIACAAFLAADVRAGDTVLEPSAGTGVLAALPAAVLDDASRRLHLNELSPVRHGLLGEIFPDASVTRHNAERIRDRLPDVRPDVVLMNPPFAASPTVGKRARHVDLAHVKSAFAALAPCGRLVAVTGANCVPDSTAWREALGSGASAPRILLAVRIPAALYRRRGTGVETRLVVLERAPAAPVDRYPQLDPFAIAADAADLVRRVAALPERLTADPEPRELEVEAVERDAGAANGSATWTPWSPASFRVPGAAEHPTPLVESAAMADIAPPVPDYRPMLPPALVADGLLSEAQLESVALAGEAHSKLLPARCRIDADFLRAFPLDADGNAVDAAIEPGRAAVRAGAVPPRLDARRRHRLRQGPPGRRHRSRPLAAGRQARALDQPVGAAAGGRPPRLARDRPRRARRLSARRLPAGAADSARRERHSLHHLRDAALPGPRRGAGAARADRPLARRRHGRGVAPRLRRRDRVRRGARHGRRRRARQQVPRRRQAVPAGPRRTAPAARAAERPRAVRLGHRGDHRARPRLRVAPRPLGRRRDRVQRPRRLRLRHGARRGRRHGDRRPRPEGHGPLPGARARLPRRRDRHPRARADRTAARDLGRLRRRVPDHPPAHPRGAGGHRRHAQRRHPFPRRQVRRHVGLRAGQAALLRPPARRHEVPDAHQGNRGRPRSGPGAGGATRLHRRGAAGPPPRGTAAGRARRPLHRPHAARVRHGVPGPLVPHHPARGDRGRRGQRRSPCPCTTRTAAPSSRRRRWRPATLLIAATRGAAGHAVRHRHPHAPVRARGDRRGHRALAPRPRAARQRAAASATPSPPGRRPPTCRRPPRSWTGRRRS